MKGRECREAALEFIKDVAFPGSRYQQHCPLSGPVCLENKFVPRPQQPSGGRFPDQPLPTVLATHTQPDSHGWGVSRGAGSVRPTCA